MRCGWGEVQEAGDICMYANSRRQWRTEEPGLLQSLGLQRVGHDSATERQPHSAFTERIQNVYSTEDFRNGICFEERLSQVLSKL